MRSVPACILGICFFLFAGVPSVRAGDAEVNTNAVPGGRPAEWAQPLRKPGLPNLHKVSDALYRGAQPTAEGMKELAGMGIKTVVCLRAFHSDEDLLKGTSLAYVPIPMKTWDAEEPDVLRFLSMVTDTNRTPVFVHCQHGADRTGTLCAIYRMVVQGWPREKAIEEMTRGGFGFHKLWVNLVKFIEGFDVESVRKKLAGKP